MFINLVIFRVEVEDIANEKLETNIALILPSEQNV